MTGWADAAIDREQIIGNITITHGGDASSHEMTRRQYPNRRDRRRRPGRAGKSRGRLLLVLAVALLTACSSPKRAPVVSRGGAAVTPQASSAAERPASYRVRRGDTLYAISWRYGLDHRTIARWNSIPPPYTIYPGQRIKLHAARSSAVSTGKSQKNRVAAQKESRKSRSTSIKNKRAPVKVENNSASVLKLGWSWPTTGPIAQHFAKGNLQRKGIKISGKQGRRIRAAESGKIVYAGSGLIGYGRLIIIKHNKHYLSAYGYNQKILVKEGDTVIKGADIARMGTDAEGRPMLHFEIRRNGAPVDPLKLLPRRS